MKRILDENIILGTNNSSISRRTLDTRAKTLSPAWVSIYAKIIIGKKGESEVKPVSQSKANPVGESEAKAASELEAKPPNESEANAASESEPTPARGSEAKLTSGS